MNVHITTMVIVIAVCIAGYLQEVDYKEVLLAIGAGYYGLQSNRED